MAISTYSELKTAVAKWLSRENQAGFSDRVPEFISLAESFLNNTLPLRINILDDELTATINADSIALPADFWAPIALRNSTNEPYELLTLVPAGELPIVDIAGRPIMYAVDGGTISFERVCDAAYTFRFRYRKRFALSDTAPTNWLLTHHPDVYLWATLYEASGYIDDGSQYAAMAKARRDEAVALARSMALRQFGNPQLQVDPALLKMGRTYRSMYPMAE